MDLHGQWTAAIQAGPLQHAETPCSLLHRCTAGVQLPAGSATEVYGAFVHQSASQCVEHCQQLSGASCHQGQHHPQCMYSIGALLALLVQGCFGQSYNIAFINKACDVDTACQPAFVVTCCSISQPGHVQQLVMCV